MKVQELLDSPDKWIQKSYARNKGGESVDYYSSDAAKWCLKGAICRCYTNEDGKILSKIENILGNIEIFNDSHSYEEVMEVVWRLDI